MSSATVAACPELHRENASPSGTPLDWLEQFLKMLPAIRRQLRFAFLNLTADDREEAEQEAIANCFVAYRRLVH